MKKGEGALRTSFNCGRAYKKAIRFKLKTAKENLQTVLRCLGMNQPHGVEPCKKIRAGRRHEGDGDLVMGPPREKGLGHGKTKLS